MLIEKTTLIEFDEVAERERITSVFKGEQQKLLLAVLDAMVAGDWDVFVERATSLPLKIVECLAEPVYELASALHDRRIRVKAYAEGYRVDDKTRSLRSLMNGIASGPESAEYPKLTLCQPLAYNSTEA